MTLAIIGPAYKHEQVLKTVERLRICMENYRYKVIEDLLALADVQIGGSRPWDIQV